MKKALIIDDDALYRQAIRLVLADSGYIVQEADNGADGLARSAEETFDVILCDMRMHGMAGDAVIDALKTHPDTWATPVILITGNPSAVRDDLPADYVLTKPFSIEALLTLLQDIG